MNGVLPFAIGDSFLAADFPDWAKLVGQEYRSGDREFRMCKSAAAIGSSSAAALYAQGKALKWSSQSATESSSTVAGSSATTDRVCAVVPHDGPVAIASGALFLGQVSGINTAGKLGDQSGDDVTAGDYIKSSSDADLGKIRTNTTTYAEGVTFARALSTQATDDGPIVYEILGRLT